MSVVPTKIRWFYSSDFVFNPSLRVSSDSTRSCVDQVVILKVYSFVNWSLLNPLNGPSMFINRRDGVDLDPGEVTNWSLNTYVILLSWY